MEPNVIEFQLCYSKWLVPMWQIPLHTCTNCLTKGCSSFCELLLIGPVTVLTLISKFIFQFHFPGEQIQLELGR